MQVLFDNAGLKGEDAISSLVNDGTTGGGLAMKWPQPIDNFASSGAETKRPRISVRGLIGNLKQRELFKESGITNRIFTSALPSFQELSHKKKGDK